MGVKFIEWFFEEFIPGLCELIMEAVKTAFVLFLIVIFFPVWNLPFVYWYLTKWKGETEDGRNQMDKDNH